LCLYRSIQLHTLSCGKAQHTHMQRYPKFPWLCLYDLSSYIFYPAERHSIHTCSATQSFPGCVSMICPVKSHVLQKSTAYTHATLSRMGRKPAFNRLKKQSDQRQKRNREETHIHMCIQMGGYTHTWSQKTRNGYIIKRTAKLSNVPASTSRKSPLCYTFLQPQTITDNYKIQDTTYQVFHATKDKLMSNYYTFQHDHNFQYNPHHTLLWVSHLTSLSLIV